MGKLFEPPPKVGKVDENGNIVLTPEEWSRIESWLERFAQFVADNYD